MLSTRVIPVLLLERGRLVKTRRFADPTYLGDPINAIRIFNEKEADELAVLDISASSEGRGPDFALIERLAGESFMPLAYGGGVSDAAEVRRLVSIGVEKVVLNTHACRRPTLVTEAAALVGSSSVVAAIDVRMVAPGQWEVFGCSGRQSTGRSALDWGREVVQRGAGELLLNSIDRDGMMAGYDLSLIRAVSDAVEVPVIACGGAGQVEHLAAARAAGASAAAAGSIFVFYGRHRAVLITYPAPADFDRAFAGGRAPSVDAGARVVTG